MYLKQIFHVFPHKTVLGEKTLDKEISLMLKVLDSCLPVRLQMSVQGV